MAVVNPLPVAVTRRDDGVLVEWDKEGHRALYPSRILRLQCPCAECVDIRPLEVRLVGAYGLRIRWSDGHGTGIYTFDRLRRECPCARCAGLGVG